MSRHSRSTRAAAALPLLAAALLGLSACGNGGATEEAGEHSVIGGVNGDVGAVAVRNAALTLGVDGGALLSVAFVNGSSETEALTGISSPRATAFLLPDDPGYVSAYGNPSNNPGNDTGGGTAGSTPSASMSAASAPPAASPPRGSIHSSTPATSPAATTVQSATLPSEVGVFYGQNLDWIEVTGLTGDPRVGASVPVTFSFRGAGSLTLQVPVVAEPPSGSSGAPTPTASTSAGG